MNRLKIAQIVGNGTPGGGVMSFLLNYYREIDRDRVQFDFYKYGSCGFDEEILALGGKVFSMPKPSSRSHAKFLFDAFTKQNYAIVHSHLTTLSGRALRQAKRTGIAVRICHAHSVSNRLDKWRVVKHILRPFAIKYATDLAACGRLAAQYMYKDLSNVTIINNAVALDKFLSNLDKEERLARFKGMVGQAEPRFFDVDTLRIGFVGRLSYQKNCHFLIEAFWCLTQIEPNAVLIMVGGGNDADLRQQAQDLKIADRVLFVGTVDNVEDYLGVFDLLWLASRFEGLPLVAIEAQAAGVRGVYSSAITKEIDICQGNVFLDTRDPAQWAKASVELAKKSYDNKDNTELLRAQGFDIKRQARILEDYYFSLVGKSEVAYD